MMLPLCISVTDGNLWSIAQRSEEHTSELQSQSNLVCRLLLEKKKKIDHTRPTAPHSAAVGVVERTPFGVQRAECALDSPPAVAGFSCELWICKHAHAASIDSW